MGAAPPGSRGGAGVARRAASGSRRTRRRASPDPSTRILRWIALAYGAWWIVSTLGSITLGTSLWGNFGRADGLLTRLSAIALFFAVHSGLQARSPRAARSLVDLVLLGSVPVVLVALGQALGLDPLPRVGDPATLELRVRSTLGQHTFLGSYLVLVVPLTAARVAGWGHARADQAPGSPPGAATDRRRSSSAGPGRSAPWR
jgi:hypothetical protein